MNSQNHYERKHLEDIQRLKKFTLMDDIFFSKCMDGQTACMELILTLILNEPSIKVLNVRSQEDIYNLLYRSIRLDVKAETSDHRIINVEIQRTKQGAGQKRMRFHASMLDVNELEKGQDYQEIHDSYVIFITEHDIGKKGLPMYHINRYVEETKEAFEDGVHLIYVNGTCKDDTPLGKLMHDFSCQDPNDMNYEILAERVRYFKTVKKGVESMCEILEQMRNESYQSGWIKGKEVGKQEGIIQKQIAIVKELLMEGSLSLKTIVKVSGMSLEEVIKTKKSMLKT